MNKFLKDTFSRSHDLIFVVVITAVLTAVFSVSLYLIGLNKLMRSLGQTGGKFTIGQQVRVVKKTVVYQTANPDGVQLGVQPPGTIGKTLEGPVLIDNVAWWKIDYDFNPDGWSSEQYLQAPPAAMNVKVNPQPTQYLFKNSRFSLNGQFLYTLGTRIPTGSDGFFQGVFTKIDTQSVAAIQEGLWPRDLTAANDFYYDNCCVYGNIVLDKKGSVYVSGNSANYDPVIKLNGDFEYVGRYGTYSIFGKDGSPAGSRTSFMLALPDGKEVWVNVGVLSRTSFVSENLTSLGYIDTYPGSYKPQAGAADNNGNVWLVGGSTTSNTLPTSIYRVRLAGNSFQIQETFLGPVGTINSDSVMYAPSVNALLIYSPSNSSVTRWDIDTQTTFGDPILLLNRMVNQDLSGGLLYAQYGVSDVVVIDIASWQVVNTFSMYNLFPAGGTGFSGFLYDSSDHSFWSTTSAGATFPNRDLWKIYLPRVNLSVEPPPAPAPNPTIDQSTLGQSCGLDVALVLDKSGSISLNDLKTMQSAFKSFADSMSFDQTHQAYFSVTYFDSNARTSQIFTSDIPAVKTAIDSVPFTAGATNWEDGLVKAGATFDPRPDTSHPNITIFASDGDPNTVNTNDVYMTSFVGQKAALNAAVTQANKLKDSGIRIISLGIGPNVRQSNMEAISSADAYYSAVDFNALTTSLQNIVTNTCGGQIISTDTTPPTISITSPLSGDTYTFNSLTDISVKNVTISADASDNVGVTKVEFYDGAVLKCTVATAPYTCAWSFTSANSGAHSWTAKAYDAKENTTTSNAVNLLVKTVVSVSTDPTPPTIIITAPKNGSTVKGTSYTIKTAGKDNKWVYKIEIYVDNTLRNTCLSSSTTNTSLSCSYVWPLSGVLSGNHTIQAKVYDSSSSTANVGVASITVKK